MRSTWRSKLRIGIETWGSDGDIRPMAALGGALAAAGHQVTLATLSIDDKDYAGLSRALGIGHVRVVDATGFDMPSFFKRSRAVANPLRLARLFFEECYLPYVDALYAAGCRLAAESDIVIGHFFMYPLRAAAEKAGVPFVTVTLWPGLVPSAHRPPHGGPNLGAYINRLQWRAVETLMNRVLAPVAGEFLQRVGLRRFDNVLTDVLLSDRLNLLAWSGVFCGEQPDWPPRHRLCGFLDVPAEAETRTTPPELEQFLDAGEPPVYMTLGSSEQLAPGEYAALLAAAAREAGVRAIIQTTLQSPLPSIDSVFFTRGGAHETVFPRCAAVVHHGGAGTTHTALRCGKPAVVASFMGEQRDWGRMLASLGVGARPLNVMRTTPGRLARRIRRVVDSPAMSVRAAELSERMRAEDGPSKAVHLVEEFAQRRGLS